MREDAANQIDLATNILEDTELFYLAHTVRILAAPGRQAYLKVLHEHSLGQLATARWLAQRSSGGWQEACRQYGAQCVRDDLEQILDLQPGKFPQEVQQARAENFMCMAIELIAHRAWRQAERSIVLPDLLFVFFHEHEDKAPSTPVQARTHFVFSFRGGVNSRGGAPVLAWDRQMCVAPRHSTEHVICIGVAVLPCASIVDCFSYLHSPWRLRQDCHRDT
jgi:hypothetical protein